MSTDRWQLLSEWHNSWLVAGADERDRLRREFVEGHPDLAAQAHALASASAGLQGFLETPALALAARDLAQDDPLLDVDTLVGPYRIVGLMARGGMGDVYRATDVRLQRDVALKLLAHAGSDDTQRIERFLQEARVTAALDHANIVKVFDVGVIDGRPYLVAELLDGETLRVRLGRGPLAEAEARRIAGDVAAGLVVAHAAGLVHRDLKPDNIFLTRSGVTKILDFGIAKLTDGPAVADGVATLTGVLLGTAGYLAPEQILGNAVDGRTDLFALGSMLFEMLTGQRAFAREHTIDTLHAILHDHPPNLLQAAGVSSDLTAIVMRLLEKAPAARFQSPADLEWALEHVPRTRAAPSAPKTSDRIQADEVARAAAPAPGAAAMPTASPQRRFVAKHTLIAGALTLALAGWAVWTRWPALSGNIATGSPIRFVVQPPPNVRVTLPFHFDISPDGGQLVYVGSEATSASRLFVRRLDRFETIPLPGTERGRGPVYSPDGRWVAFSRADTLNKVGASADSSPVMLADAIGNVNYTVTWPISNALFVATRGKPIRHMSAEGGEPTAVTSVRADTEIDHHSPTLLPGGDALLFAVHGKRNRFSIAVQSLRSKERKTLIESGFNAKYVPTGHLVFGRGSAVLAVPFDAIRLEVTGPPVTLLQQVASEARSGVAAFRVAATGTLVYQPQRSRAGRVLTWVDRAGNETPLPVAARAFDTPRVSPDGRQLAFTTADGDRRDIWIYEIANDKLTRVTQEGDNWGPLWTRDGSAVAYATDRPDASEVVLQRLDGRAPLTLGSSPNDLWPAAFSVDQKTLIVQEQPETDDYFVSRLTLSTGGRPEPLIEGSGLPWGASLSPDGRWVAYTANQSGRPEVFLQGFPVAGARRQVTVDGGREPVWRRDGRELFYRSGSRMLAVPIETTRGLSWGKPTLLFDSNHVVSFLDYDVAPDGRFLMIKPAPEEGAPIQLNVVLNWASELLSRVPVRR